MVTQRFNTVWYLPRANENRFLNILAGRVTGTLTVEANSIQFSIGNDALLITNILRITFGKQGSDFINDWVKIEYGQSASPSVAFFADGSFFGWGGLFGGTQRIFDAVNQSFMAPQREQHGPPAFDRPKMAAIRRSVNRPAGVILISALDFLAALIGVLFGVLVFLAMSTQSPGIFPPEFVTGLGVVLAMVVLFFAAIAAALGWGMWKLKKWAYVGQVVFAALDLMFALPAAPFLVVQFKVFGLLVALVRIGIDLPILWYLVRRHVRAAFWPLPGSAPQNISPL